MLKSAKKIVVIALVLLLPGMALQTTPVGAQPPRWGGAFFSFVNLDYNNGNTLYVDELTILDLDTKTTVFFHDFTNVDDDNWDTGQFSQIWGSGSGGDIVFTVANNVGKQDVGPRREGSGSAYSRVTPIMGDLENSELLMRFRVDEIGLNQYLRVWIRSDKFGSGSSFAANGYGIALHLGRDELVLQSRTSSTTTSLGSATANLTTNWHWLRLRADHDKVLVKVWNDGDHEPDEWAIEHDIPEIEVRSEPVGVGQHPLSLDVPNFATLSREIEKIAAEYGQDFGVYVETSEGIISVNETLVMSSASIIKVPILVEAIRQAELGWLIWDDEVIVQETDVVRGSGDIQGMTMPRAFTVKELAELMISVSDNTATNIVARSVGFDEINWNCIRLGCVDTLFQNSIYTSMPQDRGPHNYTNAKEISMIVKGAMEGELLSQDGKDEFIRIMQTTINARLLEYKDPVLHSEIIAGRKGGSTANPRVRHDGGFFILGDQVVYATVLTKDLDAALATEAMGLIGRRIMDYMLAND